jgi:cytochrome c oxidase assembly factor CtaG
VAIVAGSIMLLSTLSPLGEVLQRALITQMVVQCFFFVVAGYLLACGIDSLILVVSQFSNKASRAYALMRRANSAVNKYGLLTLASAVSLVGFWYTPARFDAAVMSVNLLHQMQTTLLVAGGLIFVGSQLLNKKLKLFAPVIVGKAMGLYGTFLLLTPFTVYAAYPVHEQADAGVALLIIMMGLDFTILPIWLYNYFTRGPLGARAYRSHANLASE